MRRVAVVLKTVGRRAMRVVGKNFDHAAILDDALRTLADHAPQLRPQAREKRQALFDMDEVPARDRIRLRAGLLRMVRERQQIADFGNIEAEIPAVADEAQRFKRADPVSPLIAACPWRCWEKADRLVVADGLDLHASPFGKLSNC
jgi:hypothetical protein